MGASISQIVTLALKAGSPPLNVAFGLRPATQPLPAITFNVIDFQDDPLIDATDGGLRTARIQVDAWSEHPATAEAAAEAAKLLMRAATAFVATAHSGLYDYEDDTRLYRVSRDFIISFEG